MKKYRKVTRYEKKEDFPKRKKFSGKVYTLYQVKDTAKSAKAKAERLRAEGYSARASKAKLTGSEKVFYLIYKKGAKA